MRLAVIDHDGKVLLAWPTVADAHDDLADLLAERLADGEKRLGKRTAVELAAVVRAHLLELQQQTVRL